MSCKIENCLEPIYSYELCNKHYRHAKRHGGIPTIKTCTFEDCKLPHYGKKFCRRHWERFCQREKTLTRIRKYQKLNPEKRLEAKRRYRQRRKKDPAWRIVQNLRSRLSTIVRQITKGKKIRSHIKQLGCSPQELVKYLESKFQEGMSWDNYGNGVDKWNIDHIIPISKLDPTDPESYEKLCHYTNLQPMWQPENIAKSDKIN